VQSHQWAEVPSDVDTAELDAIQVGGFKSVRLTLIPWETPTNPDGSWNFAGVDALYAAVVQRGLTPIFMLANPRSEADDDQLTNYAFYAGARYPMAMVELGNEPNTSPAPGWYKPVTAAQYWATVEPWAEAWRMSNPAALIATGGTSGISLSWQQALVTAGAADSGLISAFAVHPYGSIPFGQDCTGCDLYANLAAVKAILPSTVSIWLTEWGEPNPVPADVANWLTACADIGCPVFSYYEIRDNKAYGQPQDFGLLNADLSRKAPDAYAAAQSFLTQ
jgi:hypothetical protein